jgi:S1-C subfamily serine protease
MTFFGVADDQTVSGSGVFISAEGFVLTNNHVVAGEITIYETHSFINPMFDYRPGDQVRI